MAHRSVVAGVSAVLFAAALTACGDDDGDQGGESPATEQESVSVVVLGDSIPFNASEDCPGCVGFTDSYGTALGEELDATVDVANLSRHDGAQTRDILDQLNAGELTEPLASADVVIVSVGYNDQPPYFAPDVPCRVDEPGSAKAALAAVVATTTKCVDAATEALTRTAADALAEIRAEAPEAALAALVPYDSWNGWLAVDQAPAADRKAVTALIAYSLNAWRDALCSEVAAVDGVCIDVYSEFNGPDGGEPAGDLLAPDYTHPSQAGNDRIRDLLLEAHLVD